MQFNKNVDKFLKLKSKNFFFKKVDEIIMLKKKSLFKKDIFWFVEKDDFLFQVNNLFYKYILYIVIIYVFYLFLLKGVGKFDVVILVYLFLDYDINLLEVRMRKIFKSNVNFKEVLRGIIKVSIIMVCLVNKNEFNII